METENKKSFLKKIEEYISFLNPLRKKNKQTEDKDRKAKFESLEHNGNTWIDIENPKRKDLSELSEKYGFHTLHIEACMSRAELDRVETEEKYIFLLVHFPNYNTSERKIISNQVGIFLGKDYLITIHDGSKKIIKEAFEACKEDKDLREDFFKKSTSRILYSVLNLFEKEVSVLLQSIVQELDEIEDLVFDIKVSGIYRISQLRQKIIKLKRVSISLRENVETLVGLQSPLTQKTNRYFRNLKNDFNKLCEVLEEARETVEVYKDADFTVSTERTNKILTVLTIVFTLSIPGTIIGSLYGMNVAVPGGVESGSWSFFGEHTTFYVVIGYSVVSALLMLLYFKYKDWY